ncbi:polysaccharide biosynthesis tyrosine autokinase [Pelomonas sp. KK5]|uniref:polysaccharide biosynthesis tyrosine autokinase n=1 Tax=Pelomonas sp. KK5 TaxID=1855730 RepID=UPI00097C1367|nr:polysaccharide biosynthesis tyrosine autokinase [Pelomonas sp. KK5]
MSTTTQTAQDTGMPVHDRSIGDIIRDARNLSAAEVEQVLAYQREKGVRFGEAAIALGLATNDDVLAALAQQFHYPLAAADRRNANPELVTLNQPFSVQAEAFRAIRSQVSLRTDPTRQTRSALAVISPASGDGKTFFAANLAVSIAQLGGRVLLVDADLRGPRQHEVFGINNTGGLSTILSGRSENQVVQPVEGVPNLFVLPGGPLPPNPAELVERPAFGLLMRELCTKFDHVVVDTPAAAYGADPAVIASRCGAALIVARKDESRVSGLRDLVASLEGGGVEIAGAVMNEY